jgi:hypothetical protein
MECQESAISETLQAPREKSTTPSPPVAVTVTEDRESSPRPGAEGRQLSFTHPEVSSTFEVSADIMTLAEVGSGWLMADGREEKRTRQISSRAQPIASRDNGLMAIRAHAPLKQDLVEYRKEFRRFSFASPLCLSLSGIPSHCP